MSSGQNTVLVVDDDRAIRVSLKLVLSQFGFSIVEASRGQDALQLSRYATLDAALLDINLPGMSGIELCRSLRKQSPSLPILMLSVHGAEDRIVEALESGADDYVRKPFHMRELVARLRRVLRRRSEAETTSPRISIAGIELDSSRNTVRKNGKRISLSRKEFELLEFLMKNAGNSVPHDRLLKALWGSEYEAELQYLRIFVRKLRMKIEDDPSHPMYVKTDLHYGYHFADPTALG